MNSSLMILCSGSSVLDERNLRHIDYPYFWVVFNFRRRWGITVARVRVHIPRVYL